MPALEKIVEDLRYVESFRAYSEKWRVYGQPTSAL
jgi:hypothetical protein